MNNAASTFDILKFLSVDVSEVAAETAPKPVPSKGPRFVVTLTTRTRGNAVDIRINGCAVRVGYGPHDAVRQFRTAVYDIRAEHENAEVVLPGGLTHEDTIIHNAEALYS
jgi:hypothetical protein